MSNTISLTDITVRRQLAGCEYGELALELANDLRYGRKCATKHLNNLLLLNAYIELLELYTPEYDKSGTIHQNISNAGLSAGNIVNVFSNGVSISGAVTLASSSVSAIATQLVTAINAYQSTITAVSSNNGRKEIVVSLTLPCTNPVITATVNGGAPVTLTYFRYGECSINRNCLSEEQTEEVVDKIQKLTDLCFMSYGFTYTES